MNRRYLKELKDARVIELAATNDEALKMRIMARFDECYPRWPEVERPLLLAIARTLAQQLREGTAQAQAISDILGAVSAISVAASDVAGMG